MCIFNPPFFLLILTFFTVYIFLFYTESIDVCV